MAGATSLLCTQRGFTDPQSGEITFPNFPPKWVAKKAYSVFPRRTLSETTELAASEQWVKEGKQKKAGYLHSAFLEEFHGAVMKRRRAESVVHDFDTVGFPAKIVDDVGDDASQVVAHAAALDAGAEVSCGELDEVVVAQLVVVGNRHLQRGHRCVGVGGKILHGSEKLCLVATTVGKRREAMAGRSRREGKSSSGSLS